MTFLQHVGPTLHEYHLGKCVVRAGVCHVKDEDILNQIWEKYQVEAHCHHLTLPFHFFFQVLYNGKNRKNSLMPMIRSGADSQELGYLLIISLLDLYVLKVMPAQIQSHHCNLHYLRSGILTKDWTSSGLCYVI